ncbi:hypothetical protein DIJ63_31705 [Burkholderia pseudomallei]|nr:hypothetical protein DIJ63_31705 [Burkholderia pseudomallei]
MIFSRTGRRDFTPRNGAARGESRAAAGAVGAPGSAGRHPSVSYTHLPLPTNSGGGSCGGSLARKKK